MTIETLGYIDSFMENLDIPYEFMEWTGYEIPEVYFVGEYQETESQTKEEDGFQETSFILTGFTKGAWYLLEEAKEKIEKGITTTAILDDESGVAIFYGSALVVPTGDAELKRLQINLNIKEWKVNE